LADELREGDQIELIRSGWCNPYFALGEALRVSDYIRYAEVDGKPMAAWGLVVTDVMQGIGYPWLLTGKAVNDHKLLFYRASQLFVAEMLKRCPHLIVMIDANYPRAIGWAESIGFEMTGMLPWGPNGEPFFRAEMVGD